MVKNKLLGEAIFRGLSKCGGKCVSTTGSEDSGWPQSYTIKVRRQHKAVMRHILSSKLTAFSSKGTHTTKPSSDPNQKVEKNVSQRNLVTLFLELSPVSRECSDEDH